MAFYYRATCADEDTAIQAFHSSSDLFDSVAEVTSIAKKRSGKEVLFCFEDPEPIVRRLVDILRDSGMFELIARIDAMTFDIAVSNSV